ncbi:MAG: hypothetical protein HKN07_14790 [Acidimicrobiia bacterium]|nr:hypothetical protein [Acidimicrobiia bacterium]
MNPNPFLQPNHGGLVTGRADLVRSIIRLAAIASAILLLTVLVVTRSDAAFTAVTDNPGNSLATGSVVLTDDDGGATALFTATGMSPGNPIVACITVTYAGSLLNADIKMYGSTTGTLDTYLDTTIEEGTGGSFGDCTGFTPASTIFNNTLENYATVHTDWASGLDVYTATATPQSRTLRITVDVQNNPAAQNLSSTATFTWEAQDV